MLDATPVQPQPVEVRAHRADDVVVAAREVLELFIDSRQRAFELICDEVARVDRQTAGRAPVRAVPLTDDLELSVHVDLARERVTLWITPVALPHSLWTRRDALGIVARHFPDPAIAEAVFDAAPELARAFGGRSCRLVQLDPHLTLGLAIEVPGMRRALHMPALDT